MLENKASLCGLFVLLADVLLSVFIALRVPPAMRLLCLCAYLYIIYRGATVFAPSNEFRYYVDGCTLGGTILTAVDFVLLTDLRYLCWDPEGKNIPYDALPWWERCWTVMCFKGSCRGVNYNFTARAEF